MQQSLPMRYLSINRDFRWADAGVLLSDPGKAKAQSRFQDRCGMARPNDAFLAKSIVWLSNLIVSV
jgi:hypothetical protein